MFRLGMEGFEGNHSVMRVSDFIESWFKLRHGLGFGVQSFWPYGPGSTVSVVRTGPHDKIILGPLEFRRSSVCGLRGLVR